MESEADKGRTGGDPLGKLKWEYGDKLDQIIIRKAKGKLTVPEIRSFMNEREQRMDFGEGALCVIAWRIQSDTYTGWEMGFDKPEGDEAELFVLQDESECFCGRILHPQFCPACGYDLRKEMKNDDPV